MSKEQRTGRTERSKQQDESPLKRSHSAEAVRSAPAVVVEDLSSKKRRDKEKTSSRQRHTPKNSPKHGSEDLDEFHFKPVVNVHADWHVEEASTTLEPAVRLEYPHKYGSEFMSRPHATFFFAQESTNEVKGIISVMKKPEESLLTPFLYGGKAHRFLLHAETGFQDGILHGIPDFVEEDHVEKMTQGLQNHLANKDVSVYPVLDESLKADIVKFEEKHTRQLKTMKIAVLYAKPGQTDMAEIWENTPEPDSDFYQFMDSIAEKIVLDENWKGYRGEIGNIGSDATLKAYYKNWKGVEVVYHIAPWMDREQHRRLCGNDIGVLIYYDSRAVQAESNQDEEIEIVDKDLITNVVNTLVATESLMLQEFSKQFFQMLLKKSPDLLPYFEKSIGPQGASAAHLVMKILRFSAAVAEEDPSVSQSSFNQRKSFYNFMGLDENDFGVFCSCLIATIKDCLGPGVFTPKKEEAWRLHLKNLSRFLLGRSEFKPRSRVHFQPFSATAMGGVPQIFAVIEPHEVDKHYRMGFFQRPAIGPYSPQTPPPTHYFNLRDLPEWYYTKMYNGFMRATEVPPLDKLFSYPRRDAIKKLGEKYPRAASNRSSKKPGPLKGLDSLGAKDSLFDGPLSPKSSKKRAALTKSKSSDVSQGELSGDKSH